MMDRQGIINKTVSVLNAGGVIIYPTDTIWGLGCDATNPQAIEKLCLVKRRNPQKSMLILCADFVQVREYVSCFNEAVVSYVESQPRPTTVVYPKARNLPANLVAADGSIGVRVPQSDFCLQLLEKIGKPIVSTSANFSGDVPPVLFADINKQLLETVDYVVPSDCNDSRSACSSQVVKMEQDGSFTLIR